MLNAPHDNHVGRKSMSEALPFQIGEAVQHVIGGPIMVISWVEDGIATCEWFNKFDRLERAEFTPCLLKPAPVMMLTKQLQAG